jgi:RNA polymerase sigma factor (sigma-70 family)
VGLFLGIFLAPPTLGQHRHGEIMTMNPTITSEELLAHSAWLQRLARRLVDSTTADDLVQETWATAVRAQPDRDRPLRPWLAEVLRNLVRMRARSTARWQARTAAVGAAIDVPLPTPEELLTQHQAQRAVAEAVAGLDEPYRSTLLLCYAQDIEPTEIARQQGIPAGTVRWRLKRAIDRVRTTMDERHGGDRRAWVLALAPLTRTAVGLTSGAAATSVAAGMRGLLGKLLAGIAGLAAVGVVTWLVLAAGVPTTNRARVGVARAPSLAELAAGRSASVPRLAAAPGAGAVPAGPPSSAGGGGPSSRPPAAALPPDVIEARKRALVPGDSPARGNANAPVTIVIWSEFQSPFSARAAGTMRELEAAYPNDVRLVWKHLPLPFHESAQLASEAALAAHEQGKFWPMHDRMFTHVDQLDPGTLEQDARALGLDVPKWKAALDSGKFRKRVESDAALAKEAQITGAPTFFVNGEQLGGAQPLASFKREVDAALAVAKGLPRPPAAPTLPREPRPQGAMAMMNGMSPWPPPAIALPDKLLGDRIVGRFATAKAPLRGNPKARVEVLYFTALGMVQARVIEEGLLASYGKEIRLVAKVLPPKFSGFETGPLVVEAAMYAQAQGKFWEFHDGFGFNDVGADRARLVQIAEKAGLDGADLQAALDDGRFRETSTQDIEASEAAGMNAFGFVVDGRKADGAVALVQLVEAAIRKSGHKPPPWPKADFTLVTDPTDPSYDVQRLLIHLSPRQIFALEPRDDVWAAAVEKRLGPIIERDLRGYDPQFGSARLACHSIMCRLDLQIGKANEAQVQSVVGYLYGPMPQRGATERYFVMRPNKSRSADESLARVISKRATIIYNHRTGRARTNLSFPVDRLPKE